MPKKPKPAREPKAHRAELVAPPEPGSFDEYDRGLSDVERHLDEIMQRMYSGAWLTGVSERALAKEWNLSPDRVRKLASEASRNIRRRMRTDKEAQQETLAAILQTFEVIRAKAMSTGDLRVALDATRAIGFYMGVEPAKKLDMVTSDTAFMDGWSPQEKLAYSQGGESARRALRVGARAGMLGGANGHGGGDPSDDSSGMH